MNCQERLGSPDAYLQQSDSKKQKNCIKFNRKQDTVRSDRKKIEQYPEGPQRICFISPPKINGSQSQRSSIPSFINPNVLKVKENFAILKEQSYILAYESQLNIDQKMNDSILSLMDELKGQNQRRHENEVQEYLFEISKLRQEIDVLQNQNNQLKGKVKDLELLQEFLIERQTYISEVTDKNIFLSEQMHRIQKEKQTILGQFNQMQVDCINQRQIYEDYITNLKKQRETEKSEFDMMLKLNIQLNQKLQEDKISKKERFKRHSNRDIDEQNTTNSPQTTKNGKNSRLKTVSLVNPIKQSKNRYLDQPEQSTNILDGCETLRSKETDLSQLNVRSMDEFSILQKLNDQNQPCDCKDVTKKLKQKIRYNQIQIDILKRIKTNAEKVKADNERLKSQNKKLLSKIEKVCSSKVEKKDRRKSINSDSSLQLSLSPKKHDK